MKRLSAQLRGSFL